MEQYYTNERNVQILIDLLKQHGIKKVVASPGSTNVTFVASIQQDPWFEIYSCVDERSAAYMACGMAAESMEPVALSCTGATASRNYFPALTEAYYRALPVLAITSTQDESLIGHLKPQVLDRSQQPKDIVKESVHLQTVKNAIDEWDVTIKANKAILALNHHGIGPVHINLTTTYSRDYSLKTLPPAHKITRICSLKDMSELPTGRIAIYVGSHTRWSKDLTQVVDQFCEAYNAVVFTDYSSNYRGKYGICYAIASVQRIDYPLRHIDLLIHIGMMSDEFSTVAPQKVWRVNEDGKLADPYKKLERVFEMSEYDFFNFYIQKAGNITANVSFYTECNSLLNRLYSKLPELPFSHIWVASQLSGILPKGSTLHLGILSPLRSWSFFRTDKSIEIYCNQGGFGIDGNLSSMIGASFVNPDKLFFCVVGDLSFFYDLNSLGNRHIGNNVRILLVNNSLAAEFHLFKQKNTICVNGIDKYISAGGHFGRQSPDLVRHYTTDLGFEYLTASDKEEFKETAKRFTSTNKTERPMVFEIFTQVNDENEALYRLFHIEEDTKSRLREMIKDTAAEKIFKSVKDVMKK